MTKRLHPHLPRRPVLAGVIVLLLVATACSTDGEVASVVSDVAEEAVATDASATAAPADSSGVTAGDASTEPTAATTTAGDATSSTPAASSVPDGVTSIVVDSTPEQYFVLYVRPDASSSLELPVAISRGESGSTTLTDGRTELPADQYRVETLSVEDPADVDDDGLDDLTELADPVNANPLNAAPAMDSGTGAVIIPDHATFEALSYQGDDVARDSYLAGLEYVKFWIVDTDTDNPKVYFMNTERFRAHPMFAEQVGLGGGRGPAPGKMRGDIVFAPDETAPDGTTGRYRFAFQPNDAYSFQEIALAYEVLVTGMPDLAGKLFYEPFAQSALPRYEQERALYDAGRVPVLLP